MLKYLRLENIILVEKAEIPFQTGLNVLTGETGSGKSAIMHGLSLAIGERADTTLIRRGCEKGIVEAIFDIDSLSSLKQLLSIAGIDHEANQEFIIRREISTSGKGRIFINHQAAQLSLLRQIGSELIQMVGQHANQHLFSTDYQRHTLDLYGDLTPFVQSYQKSFNHENQLKQELDLLINQESQRLREMDIYQRELEELTEANLQEGEDEELFAEYSRLAHSKELAEKVYEINQALSGERQAALTLLHRQKGAFESIIQFDPHLSETAQAFDNALLELQEISHTLRQYQSRIQHDPERLSYLNERLTLINRLKKKYGSSIAEIQAYQGQAKEKLSQLKNADTEIEEIKSKLIDVQQQTNQLAEQLTKQREEVAIHLEQALTHQLHTLNMSKAKFIISVDLQKRSSQGQDKVEFYLQPNTGEHQVALKEGASGGEIARVSLALQTLLAGKEKTPTLIFDEVDANIGGKTATTIGDNLKEIGRQHQVICITHFPQVAAQAEHHLQISKQEKEGRTVTTIRCLDPLSKQQELERMLGGQKEIIENLSGNVDKILTFR